MSKIHNGTFSDWARLGYIEVDGKLVKAESVAAKKVVKIEPDVNSFPKPNANGKPYYHFECDDFNFITVKIKPMSVNDAWKGKRFKTDQYKQYALAVSLMLPKQIIVPHGLLRVYYEFGLSSMGGDWDNPVKPLQDILSHKYKFNDNRIRSCGGVNLILVPKGEEYLKFRFESLLNFIKLY